MNHQFFLDSECRLARVTSALLEYCEPFSCGDADLDEFFSKDAIIYEKEMLGKTYCWILKEDMHQIVAMITLANAGIQTTHLQNNPRRKLNKAISFPKRGRTYPAVLIGRLGVNKKFQGRDFRIGAQIMDFIKDWFKSYDNKTGCRFILVDAVNTPHTLTYYERNGFHPLFPNEEDEKDFYKIPKEESLRTRMYYYDLL